MSIQFGNFNGLCSQSPLSFCPYVGSNVEPTCYARNVEIAGTLLFQPATLIIHIVALVMTSIMIWHIKSKYTAVGRKEIVMFFYMYMACTFCEFFLVSTIIPPAHPAYPHFAALHVGLITSTFWCLLLNGFVGFQFAEDGTPLSLWTIRMSSFLILVAVYFLSIATFLEWGGFSRQTPVGLWIVYLVFNGAALLVYFILQVILVATTLADRWPIGDIAFGFVFFIMAQICLFAVAPQICETGNHYIDGLSVSNLTILLAVMMIYKYWDSITKEDLEFAVDGTQHVWEIKEPLLGGTMVSDEGSGPGSSIGSQSRLGGAPNGVINQDEITLAPSLYAHRAAGGN